MLKKASSFALTSLRGSTYRTEGTASPHRSLRPRWKAFLNILHDALVPFDFNLY